MDIRVNFTLVVSQQEQPVSPRLVAAEAVEQFERLDSPWTSRSEITHQMESLLVQFGIEEDQRLAVGMPPREISVTVDETFHPQICLVGMEPVSNFIFLAEYQPRRDADTWNRCLSLPLASQSRRAEERLGNAQARVADLQAQFEACGEQCPESSQGAELEQQLQQARAEEGTAGEHLSACQDSQQRASEARRGLSHDYHPFDLDNGQPLDEDDVGRRLAGHFDTLQQVAEEAGLPAHATKKLADRSVAKWGDGRPLRRPT